MNSKYSRDQLIDECLKLRRQYEHTALSLPAVKKSSIVITFKSTEHSHIINEIDLLTKFPVQETQHTNASVVELNLLNNQTTNEYVDDHQNNEEKQVRRIFEIWIEFESDKELKFEAGDSIGCTCGNFDDEVTELIDLLALSAKKNDLIEIENPSKTISLPRRSTLTGLIKFCVEIRAIPKKVALLAFSAFCTDQAEKNCLVLLSSKEGAKLYDEFILEKHFGFLDLLRNFKSCKPDLHTFLSHSINFVPRYYSVIECAEDGKRIDVANTKRKYKLKIAFNVTYLPPYYDRKSSQLYGIFTGKMNQIYEKRRCSDLLSKMNDLSINQENLYIFKRKNLMFRLEEKVARSFTIMISIGTGITPFLSLIKQVQNHNSDANNKIAVSDMFKRILNPDAPYESTVEFDVTSLYLIHGCTTKNNCLYLDELNEFHKSGVLAHLQVCFSREDYNGPKHVQDYLMNCKILKPLLVRSNANIYVCGDQNKFPKDVFNAFVKLLDTPDASATLKSMQKEKRYLEDKWL